MRSNDASASVPAHVNDVHLLGVLAACELRALPSGDELLTFRLTVRRPAPSRARPARDGAPARRAATVDAIDCVASGARVAKLVQECPVGEVLEITGSMQRRFWRSPAGPASTYQVEAVSARRVRAAKKRGRNTAPTIGQSDGSAPSTA
jgi:single-strand DNA-binding protein